ncbi:MAG: class I SAM-dependent methyltransferase [Desulfobacula sp.]|nr:class I SAM-dependent methyltransferase [Desulfobacula sp.]
MDNRLDNFVSEYKPGAITSIENELILNWYPERILGHVKGASSILELGLGHGHSALQFSPHFTRHVVVEGSQTVIDLFNQNNNVHSIEIKKKYFETFETDEKFDVIVMGFVLEHVHSPGLLLDRYSQFLTSKGRMFIAVPNGKCLNRRLGLELGLIHDIYELNKNDLALGHKRQFCRDTLKKLLYHHQYKVIREEGIYLKPLPLEHLKTLPRFEDNLRAMLQVGIDFPDLCVGILVEVTHEE